MRSINLRAFSGCLLLLSATVHASIFGEENIALLKLVAGQITELERLSETIGVLEDQRNALLEINRGIDKALAQIDAVEEIIIRAQGLEPNSVRDISALNRQIEEMRLLAYRAEEVIQLKIALADLSISQAAIQSETSYKMGQEMIGTGSTLAAESRTASPGRAAQITAAAESSQMMAQGVQLQGMAHLIQLQAETLDLQKTLLAQQNASIQAQNEYFRGGISKKPSVSAQRRKPNSKGVSQ
ncbi:MAG: hypothetical protein A2428_15535 [Bdellovibrionales bacterium RIFOXYC1_FULL_54_43]|nr:MAG: hypothetical protein A2428_15535 [Bdellovibrionales bacterium RIFOXYC1_FULL_54_43]OFZ84779.1 MAG: hypothetical protein A2603_05355 [Bdellovibrionales bacterium RIFOXYD1_FULL_55_31]